MFIHADFHLIFLEFYIHAQKIVLVSSRLRHLTKFSLNCLDYLIDHLWVHVADLVIIHIPAHCEIFTLDV